MSEVHSNYKQYQFNVHGVCLNPDVALSFSNKNIACTIETAETEQKALIPTLFDALTNN